MKSKVILDTGALISYLNQEDDYHLWAKNQFNQIKPPLFTCEAVLSETCFLLRRFAKLRKVIFEWLNSEIIQILFDLQTEADSIKHLMERYKNVPMSLADACLVRMSEQIENSSILTIDSVFFIYKKHGRHIIPIMTPLKN